MGAGTQDVSLKSRRSQLGLLLLPTIGWLWLLSLLLAALLGFAVRRHHFESAGIAFGAGCVAFGVILWRGMAACPATQTQRPFPGFTVLGAPIVAAILAFGWSLGLGPLSDDFVLQEWAKAGDWTPKEWPYLRPLPLALWQATVTVGGGWAALHGINVLLHATNSALVAWLAAGWIGPRAGTVAGVLFALFPAGTEAVAWTAGVFDLAATFFVLLSALVWMGCQPSPWRTAALMACCVGGLLSKESAVVIPAILALISVVTADRRGGQLRLEASALVLTTLTTCGVLVGRAAQSASLASHLENLPGDRRELKDLIVRPFAALAVPFRSEAGLTTEAYVVALAVLLAFGWLVLRVWKQHARNDRASIASDQFAALLVGVGWVVLSALPLLLQFFVSPTLEGSRYLYLPSVGFVVALSAIFSVPGRDLVLPAAVLAVLIPIYATALRSEQHIWRQAADTRDLLLGQAATAVRTVPCRALTILDAPDNVRGAFIFRVGLPAAVSGLPYVADGESCVARWNGSALVLHRSGPASINQHRR